MKAKLIYIALLFEEVYDSVSDCLFGGEIMDPKRL